MKKYLLFTLSSLIFAATNAGATNWWQQTTICRPNNSQCWSNNVAVDIGMWDATSSCWGIKNVCGEAMTSGGTDNLIPKLQITNGNTIKSDFDINQLSLNKDCWGIRKTRNSGTEAMVGSQYVKVYCAGVLNDADEVLKNGEIKIDGAQPMCSDLAPNGYVAILNGTCYGKYFNPAHYVIECDGGELPNRIIALNGATNPIWYASAVPATMRAATDIFNMMRAASQAQKDKHFK